MANVLIFGDSISYGCWDAKGGWAFRLKNKIENVVIHENFIRNHFVYPLGIPGDTTHTLLQRFKQEADARVVAQEETIFIFAIGINDSIYNTKTNSFITPLWKFKNNLYTLIQSTKRYTKNSIFIGLTPVDEKNDTLVSWLPECSYKNEFVNEYNEGLREVCEKESVTFIPLLSEWLEKDYRALLVDGLHPNSDGHEVLFETLQKHLSLI